MSRDATRDRTPRPHFPEFSDEERADICRLLRGKGKDPKAAARHWPGSRCGILLRHYPILLRSPSAALLVRHICDLLKPQTEPPEACTDWRVFVGFDVLARWMNLSDRQVSTLIREVTRYSWPLLAHTPGKKGRACSEFMLVLDPFAFRASLEAAADHTRARRHEQAVRLQAAAMRRAATGDISADQAEHLARQATRQREWNLPPRPAKPVGRRLR